MIDDRAAPTSALRLCYVRRSSGDIAASARFAEDLLGLQPVLITTERATFRSDTRDHSLALTRHEPEAIGFEIADLADAAARLRKAGAPIREADAGECLLRSVRAALFTRDPSGNAIELVVRPGIAAQRFFPPRDAGVTGLRAVGLRSTDVTADTAFWMGLLGAEVADWVGDITYLRLDDAHHRVALYPSDRPGILYQAYSVRNVDAIMRNSYILADHQVDIVHGPGREATSGDVFLRFRAPDGLVYSFQTADSQPSDTRGGPRQFLASAAALCAWGSRCEAVPELALP